MKSVISIAQMKSSHCSRMRIPLEMGELYLIYAIRVVRRISNNCGFGISDFGNKVKYLYFLQNIKAYASEIQHPKSAIVVQS